MSSGTKPDSGSANMPRPLRFPTAKAYGQLANPDLVDPMRERKLRNERDTSWPFTRRTRFRHHFSEPFRVEPTWFP